MISQRTALNEALLIPRKLYQGQLNMEHGQQAAAVASRKRHAETRFTKRILAMLEGGAYVRR